MGEHLEFRFGNMAVQKGYVTMEQIKESLRVKMELEASGIDLKLGEILLRKGFMTKPQVEEILQGQARKAPAQVIAGFQLVSKLGEGAMGAVYKAKQVNLNRLVALKVLPKKLARNREFVARFQREAKLVALLDHPNIVRGIDVGEVRGIYYLAMEFVEGESIGQKIARQGTLSESEAIHYALQTARALEHAHGKGILHRDIKPDNILVDDRTDAAKLVDLGLARLAERSGASDDEMQLTQKGDAVGTPNYLSPEQARGESGLTPGTDIYGLGATLYHMVTGSPPFKGNSAAVVMTMHITQKLEPPNQRNPAISAALSAVIEKMMAKRPENRYESAGELIDDLERLQRGRPPKIAAAGSKRQRARTRAPAVAGGGSAESAGGSTRQTRVRPAAQRVPAHREDNGEEEYDDDEEDETAGGNLKKALLLLLFAAIIGAAAGSVYLFGVKKMSVDQVVHAAKNLLGISEPSPAPPFSPSSPPANKTDNQ